MSSQKRSLNDEQLFIENLRREEPIKTEVIVELRGEVKKLMESQARILEALILANDSLRIYRVDQLELVRRCLGASSHCVPGCSRHEWNDMDGWHRKER